MRPINDAHVAEPGLAVVEVAAADDETAFAVQELLAARWAIAPADRTAHEPGEPGIRLRCFLDLRQQPNAWSMKACSPSSCWVTADRTASESLVEEIRCDVDAAAANVEHTPTHAGSAAGLASPSGTGSGRPSPSTRSGWCCAPCTALAWGRRFRRSWQLPQRVCVIRRRAFPGAFPVWCVGDPVGVGWERGALPGGLL
ncbi:DUF6207 family protein [Streptomyces sp. NPDC088816]|uniref:DUF6207 family protein n=1 Tax=Streptomyces sp. NPDC088816 TaxID=3365906 RepID=UPI0037F7F360